MRTPVGDCLRLDLRRAIEMELYEEDFDEREDRVAKMLVDHVETMASFVVEDNAMCQVAIMAKVFDLLLKRIVNDHGYDRDVLLAQHCRFTVSIGADDIGLPCAKLVWSEE
jgi:hypothetical protein